MRLVIITAMLVAAAYPQDPRDIVRRSVELDRKHLQTVRQYTFVERQEERQFDGEGKVKQRESRTWDVTMLEGSPYRRLIARDDKPLSAKEEAREQEKLSKSIEQRRKETDIQRQARLADAERRLQKQREPMREIPDAFDFRMLGEETSAGVATWLIEATPHPGYQPKSQMAHFFPKLRAKLWIAKADYHWVRAEAESIETIAFAGIVARVAPGATIHIQQNLVNQEVWLPLRIEVSATARIAIFKKFRGQIEITYRDFRKFQADSRVVSTETQN